MSEAAALGPVGEADLDYLGRDDEFGLFGHLRVAEGADLGRLELRGELIRDRLGDPAADAAGEAQRAARVVVAEQQRADPLACPLLGQPAADDELLAA